MSTLSVSNPDPPLQPDPQSPRLFLTELWKDCPGYAHFWTPDGPNNTKQSLWFPADDPPALPSYWIGNCYLSVNCADSPGEPYQKIQNVTVGTVGALYCEFDAKDYPGGKPEALAIMEALDPAPTVVTDSGGGYHCYWMLAEPYRITTGAERQHIADLQRAIVAWAGGDKTVHDLARILRIPRTRNFKYTPPRPVGIVHADYSKRYDLADLEKVLASYLGRETPYTVNKNGGGVSTSVGSGFVGSDSELIAKATNAKYGDRFRKLWAGDLSDHGGDHSSADLALCNILAFWTRKDPAQMDRLFRQSGLMRGKWDRDDYRDGTIQNAIDSTNEVYNPGAQDPPDPEAQSAAEDLADWSMQNQTKGGGNVNANSQNGAGQKPGAQAQAGGSSGQPANSEYRKIIRELDSLGYSFRLNDLDDVIEVNGERLDDVEAATIRTRMRDRGYKNGNVIQDSIVTNAGENRYHPIREYLEGLSWDGANHIAALAGYLKDTHDPIKYRGGIEIPTFQVWLGKWLIGSVAKVFRRAQNPMLVLDGGQNLGKSFFAQWLGSPMPDYFVEASISPDSKDDQRRLVSRWIWEAQELGSTVRKADVDALKAFLTVGTVTFRKPYGHHDTVKPALASFIGTVNNDAGFLRDSTGNRRFLIVHLDSIDWGYSMTMDPNQVWAQAMALYKRGDSWNLDPVEVTHRDELNEGFQVEDHLEPWIRKYCDIDPLETTWFTTSAEIAEELQFQGYKGTTRALQMELPKSLVALGIERARRQHTRGYVGIRTKLRGIP